MPVEERSGGYHADRYIGHQCRLFNSATGNPWWGESIYTPDSVSALDYSNAVTAIHLDRQLPDGSCGIPGRSGTDRALPVLPCSGWGLPSRPSCLNRWCALTAPFHPYLCELPRHRRFDFCGTFLRVTPTGRYPASCPVESGRSSAPCGDAAARSTHPTAVCQIGRIESISGFPRMDSGADDACRSPDHDREPESRNIGGQGYSLF